MKLIRRSLDKPPSPPLPPTPGGVRTTVRDEPWKADQVRSSPINYAEIEETLRDTRMPFGKHKGVPARRLPTDYLKWLRDWLRDKDRDGDLRDAIETEWDARFRSPRSPTVNGPQDTQWEGGEQPSTNS